MEANTALSDFEGDYLSQLFVRFPGIDDAGKRLLHYMDVRSDQDLYSLTSSFGYLNQLGLPVEVLSSFAARGSRKLIRAGKERREDHVQISGGAIAPKLARMGRGSANKPGSFVQGPTNWSLSNIVKASLNNMPNSAILVEPQLHGPTGGLAWDVRNQGDRGTCVAFATAALREVDYYTKNKALKDFSEQFLYWACKTRDGFPNDDGTTIDAVSKSISTEGVCDEAVHAYLAKLTPGSPYGGKTPDVKALAQALNYRLNLVYFEDPNHAAQRVLDVLVKESKCVVVSLPLYYAPKNKGVPGESNWDSPISWQTGKVFPPPPGGHVDGGHAVCIVGFVPDAAEVSGGYFIFKNSWSTAWGSEGGQAQSVTPAPGYGFVSATYVENFTWEIGYAG